LRLEGETWIALPGQVADWWRLRNELNLVNVNGSWRIEEKGSERASIAYAALVDNRITYEFANHGQHPFRPKVTIAVAALEG
jgi:hypothetical protein